MNGTRERVTASTPITMERPTQMPPPPPPPSPEQRRPSPPHPPRKEEDRKRSRKGGATNDNIKKKIKSVHAPLVFPLEVKTVDLKRKMGKEYLIVLLENCVAVRPLSNTPLWEVIQMYGYANPYDGRVAGPHPNLATRETRPQPGAVEIRSPPSDTTGPTFAFVFNAYRMGGVKSEYYLKSSLVDQEYIEKSLHQDSLPHRLEYLKRGLTILASVISDSKKFGYIENVIFLNAPFYYEPEIRSFLQDFMSSSGRRLKSAVLARKQFAAPR